MSGNEKAEADLNTLLSYIKQREQALSRYSDKLRQNVTLIENLFAPAYHCRICENGEDMHGYYKGDCKGMNPEYLEKEMGKFPPHEFVPAIYVSIDVIDSEPFWTDDEESYYLGIVDGRLRAIGVSSEVDLEDPAMRWTKWLSCLSREQLKAFVKSGRLVPFLQKVADKLQMKTEEYKEVAEIAEKIAKVIQE